MTGESMITGPLKNRALPLFFAPIALRGLKTELASGKKVQASSLLEKKSQQSEGEKNNDKMPVDERRNYDEIFGQFTEKKLRRKSPLFRCFLSYYIT